MAKVSKEAREEAVKRLHEILKPGDTVYCVLRGVSRSGMMRKIDLYKFAPNDRTGFPLAKFWLSRLASKAAGFGFDEKAECIRVGGCGMDMGFHLVSTLAAHLWREGFDCTGERCPSSDHSNHRTSTFTRHAHGDYALHCEWI